jgi:uncharacterized membrane protein
VYEWIKALHVIAVISWMAGMLYLPRLFIRIDQTWFGRSGGLAPISLPLFQGV